MHILLSVKYWHPVILLMYFTLFYFIITIYVCMTAPWLSMLVACMLVWTANGTEGYLQFHCVTMTIKASYLILTLGVCQDTPGNTRIQSCKLIHLFIQPLLPYKCVETIHKLHCYLGHIVLLILSLLLTSVFVSPRSCPCGYHVCCPSIRVANRAMAEGSLR